MESPRDQQELQELQELIGYSFNKSEILLDALRTRAYANEHNITEKKIMNRFQTLGDALIDVIVIQKLLSIGEYTPGNLTKGKIKQVRNTELPTLARAINLVKYIQWGKGQIKEKDWNSDRLMSNCLESLIGAVYLHSERDMEVTARVYERIENLTR